MKSNITQFCNALERLDPENSDGLIAYLYDLVDLLEDVNEISIIYDPVFRFLENIQMQILVTLGHWYIY
ncbi:MAG: hypothetical protein JKX98_07540 [Alcanivoracaceae bacterium]|nr:hypothetical protein [Alcanivoracaceae bacterium]